MPSISRSSFSTRILSFCDPTPRLERAHHSLSSHRQERRRSRSIYNAYQENKRRETISTDASHSSSHPYSTVSSNPFSTTSSRRKSRVTTPGLTSATTEEDQDEEEDAWTDPPTARNSYGYSVDSLCVLWRKEVDEWKPFWRAEVKTIAPAWKPWEAVYGNSWSDDRRNSGWAGPKKQVGFADDPWMLPPLDESASLGVSAS